ncbi:hypothetical protein CFP56_036203 [Quercus suber]|uniref:Secreted protein n=1 Tax=Quercus suber TaxID=58331 RepID=A0AAW0J7E5_QUESU
MPHRTRPMTALLVFTGLNVFLVSTITPVYDFVCFLPYWERRVWGGGGAYGTGLRCWCKEFGKTLKIVVDCLCRNTAANRLAMA